jgi:hypothetical protein
VAVRAVVVALDATHRIVSPLPVPLAGDAVTQLAPDVAVHPHPVVVVTVTLAVPPPAATDALVGDTVKAHVPACVTVTARPATVTVAVRAVVAVLAATVSCTVPLPDPLVGATVTQLAPDVAVHPHPVVVVTVTLAVPPPAATDALVGDTVKAHVPACVTVTARPATVTVAVRAVVAVLAATVSCTVPLPDPLVGATVTQLAPDVAVHPHPVVVVTVTLAVPPPAATDALVGDTVKAHVVPPEMVNGFETLLREVPWGPTAATRDSYTPPGSGQPAMLVEKS